jgi:DNA-binding MarR family transcriptional regulator
VRREGEGPAGATGGTSGTRGALETGVNAIFFGLKRAFHGTLRITRRLLARLGLTAARFDLLYALPHGRRDAGSGMLQSQLRRELGVSRPTVSRMLASLEELGLVRRERDRLDRRQLSVKLTDRGRGLIRRAARIFIRSGLAQLAVDTALGADATGERWYDEAHCLAAMGTLDGLLGRIRTEFGDIARLSYPWHPEESLRWDPDE